MVGQKDVQGRVIQYLDNGGLFNPELMNHDAVSLLIQDLLTRVQELEARLHSTDCAACGWEVQAWKDKVQDLEAVITQHTRLRADLLIRIDELEREVVRLKAGIRRGNEAAQNGGSLSGEF